MNAFLVMSVRTMAYMGVWCFLRTGGIYSSILVKGFPMLLTFISIAFMYPIMQTFFYCILYVYYIFVYFVYVSVSKYLHQSACVEVRGQCCEADKFYLIFIAFLIILYVSEWVRMGINLLIQFSPSTIGVLGIELTSSDLVYSLSHLVNLPICFKYFF